MSKFQTVIFPILLASLASPLVAEAPSSWENIAIPPLDEFEIPLPQRHELDNGLTVFLLEDHELPLIRLNASIRGGSQLVAPTHTGLDEIYGEAWRTGGTTTRTGDELDDLLEARAARVESSMGTDSASLTLDCLVDDFDPVLEIFLDLLHNPEFREDKIEIAKKSSRTGIARRNDDPQGIMWREAGKLGFGPESPYARYPEYATIDAITRDDLVQWHQRITHPERTIVNVVGDFDSQAMLATIKEKFGSWSKGSGSADPEVTHGRRAEPGVYFIPKDDVPQAQVAMTHLGITRKNPDYYAVEVLNEILSGSFGSRLFTNVRSKKGLAYVVFGGVFAGNELPGLFFTGMGTGNETVAAGIDALYEELDGVLGANPVTEEEVQNAKDAILNSFIFKVDSRRKVMSQLVLDAFYGYPPDFLQQYQPGIEKVTRDDVMRVAKKYIHRDQIAILVLGRAADFDRPLTEFGEVTEIDITIPTPEAPSAAGASAEAQDEGRALFDKAVKAMGGLEALSEVSTLRAQGTLTIMSPMGEMKGPFSAYYGGLDTFRQDMEINGNAIRVVVSPEDAFMAMGPMAQDLPSSQRDDILRDLKSHPIMIARNLESEKLTFASAGTEEVDGRSLAVLDVTHDGASIRFFIDPESGQIVQSRYQSSTPQGPMELLTRYLDPKPVGSLMLHHREEILQEGQPFQTVVVESYEINPEAPADLLSRPKP